MSEYSLQPARLVHAPVLAGMAAIQIELGLRPSWHAGRIARHITHPDSMVLIAKARSEVAGFAIMQYGDDRAHLNLLAVAPTHQRRGIGRQLVRWLEETAFTAGTFVIRLELRTTNAQAHAFYASLGYRATGRIDGYYQGLEHATLMEHDLRICRSAQADINGST